MKPIAIVIRIVLAAALLGGAGAGAQGSAAKPAQAAERAPRGAYFDAAERALLKRLQTPQAARAFRQYNAANSRQIQDHLADIYGQHPDYMRDAGGPRRLLRDGIVGPVTLHWLTQFCKQYGIVANDPHFERAVVASLEQVANIVRAHPEWEDILSSAEFEAWINGQQDDGRTRSLQRRRSGDASQVIALIEQFEREREQAPAARRAEPITLTFGYDPARRERTGDPAQLAARLKPLTARAPDEARPFEEDVRDALDGLHVPDATLALIKRYSRVDAYLVDDALLQRLRREGLPEDAVIALKDELEGREFHNAQEFLDKLREVSDASEQREAIERKRLAIVRGARVVRFQVPATLADSLAADAPPELVSKMFSGFKKIEYPTRALFDAALDWQVRRALAMCREPRRNKQGQVVDWGWQGELADGDIAALGELMPNDPNVSVDRIAQLRARQGGCSIQDLVDADAQAYHVARFVEPILDGRMDFEIPNRMPTSSPRTSGWAMDWCRCARPERDGMAYGFFPLWLDAGERQIDFGALTRIGLYGVTVDDQGRLHGPQGMEGLSVPAHLASMMREAHRHDVKVDWVLSRSDWSGWGALTPVRKSGFLEQLRRDIKALLERPPEGRQTMTWLGSLGRDHGPIGGDGVVLHLRGFPAADKELFKVFLKELSNELEGMQPKRRLSIAVDYDDLIQSGPAAYRHLVELIERINPLDDHETFASSGRQMLGDLPILAFVPEPTQDSKKALRTAIQNALHGVQAARLQWAIVPVVQYDRVGSGQLADDIVFTAANYHGIGFWPLAFADPTADPKSKTPRDANLLLANYLQPFGDPSDKISYWGSYLCPHRLWLRWLFWGSLALAIGVGAVYFNCRGCNERVDNSGLYFAGMVALLALPLLTLSVLVVSDPLLTAYWGYTLALYGTGGIVSAVLVARYYFKKSRRKLP
jgi:hypothetical protein